MGAVWRLYDQVTRRSHTLLSGKGVFRSHSGLGGGLGNRQMLVNPWRQARIYDLEPHLNKAAGLRTLRGVLPVRFASDQGEKQIFRDLKRQLTLLIMSLWDCCRSSPNMNLYALKAGGSHRSTTEPTRETTSLRHRFCEPLQLGTVVGIKQYRIQRRQNPVAHGNPFPSQRPTMIAQASFSASGKL